MNIGVYVDKTDTINCCITWAQKGCYQH